jgi:LPXTG-motif cell wall-anchored protein
MFPSTGSTAWDTVLAIGIAAALLVSILLLVRDYRGRR